MQEKKARESIGDNMNNYLKVIRLDINDFESTVSYETNYALTDITSAKEDFLHQTKTGNLSLLIETGNMVVLNTAN